MDTIICPECSKEIPSDSLNCPNCGFPLSETEENAEIKTAPKKTKNITVGIIAFIISAIMIVFSITRVTNSKYAFYKDHYQTCINGYYDCLDSAKSYNYGFFRSSYETLADKYKQLADDDLKEIWKYRITAICSMLIVATGLVIGIRNIRKD